MSVRILTGDCRAVLPTLPADSVDCVVTSPPYWGLRDYGVDGQLGLEPTLGEHLAVMVAVFREVRRVLKPTGTLWLNYGDCYATAPNGRSAAATKAAGNDDRAFRDKPFSTVGPIYDPAGGMKGGGFRGANKGNGSAGTTPQGRIIAGGYMKRGDLCMVANRLAIALQEDGWWIRSEIIWGKRNPMPDSSGKYRPSTAHEKVWLLTKAPRYHYDAEAVAQPVSGGTNARLAQNLERQRGSDRANGGAKTNGAMKAVRNRALGNDRGKRDYFSPDGGASSFVESRYLRNYEPAQIEVWEINSKGFAEAHFATFPPELAARCIKAGCPKGGTVLDPFGGAGTTGLVADGLQRDAILIELNPEYADMAERRLARARGPLFAEAAE